jgi:hypothetical protein
MASQVRTIARHFSEVITLEYLGASIEWSLKMRSEIVICSGTAYCESKKLPQDVHSPSLEFWCPLQDGKLGPRTFDQQDWRKRSLNGNIVIVWFISPLA